MSEGCFPVRPAAQQEPPAGDGAQGGVSSTPGVGACKWDVDSVWLGERGRCWLSLGLAQLTPVPCPPALSPPPNPVVNGKLSKAMVVFIGREPQNLQEEVTCSTLAGVGGRARLPPSPRPTRP